MEDEYTSNKSGNVNGVLSFVRKGDAERRAINWQKHVNESVVGVRKEQRQIPSANKEYSENRKSLTSKYFKY
jgi:hypothetical protein